MKEGNEALDGEAISSIVADLISIRAENLLPQIGVLHNKGLVFNGIVGDMQSIERKIKNSRYNEKRELTNSIYDRYENAMTWPGYEMKYGSKEVSPQITHFTPPPIEIKKPIAPPIQKPKRVSKNAPCPCGSGKKYKRCCMKK